MARGHGGMTTTETVTGRVSNTLSRFAGAVVHEVHTRKEDWLVRGRWKVGDGEIFETRRSRKGDFNVISISPKERQERRPHEWFWFMKLMNYCIHSYSITNIFHCKTYITSTTNAKYHNNILCSYSHDSLYLIFFHYSCYSCHVIGPWWLFHLIMHEFPLIEHDVCCNSGIKQSKQNVFFGHFYVFAMMKIKKEKIWFCMGKKCWNIKIDLHLT